MNLDQYQAKAVKTAIYPTDKRIMGLTYCALKLNGEAGEFAEKVGKVMRDDNFKVSRDKREALLYELGDVLWYLANCAKELGTTLEVIAVMNLDKLAKRQKANKLKGSGDNR